MRRDEGPASTPGGWWKLFSLTFGAGVVAVFLYEMVGLVRVFFGERGAQKGAVGAILFMILVTVFAVVGIGGGLARALWRQQRRDSADSPGRDE
ncbi:MAG: hypothetical protein ACE5HQ_09030 [Gemmatimonadota bacterium]